MCVMPYGSYNDNVEGTNGFNQTPSPMNPNTGVFDITTGLENVSLVGLQQPLTPMQPIGPPLMPSTFSTPGQSPQWHMVPWVYAHHTPQATSTPFPNIMSRGPSTPAPSSSGFATMSPMGSDVSMMTPFSSHQSPASVRPYHHDYSGHRLSHGHYRSDGRRQNATRINRGYFSPPGPHHNHVDIQKIREGTDVRTTVS